MNTVIKVLQQRFYIRELLMLTASYLFMEGMFAWLLVQDSGITERYQKTACLLIYAFMLYNFGRLKRTEQIYLGLFTLLMVRLVFESLSKYDTFFRQFTMFTVLFPVVFMLFTRFMMRKLDIDLLEFLARFYLFTYIAFMLLFGRGFSLSLDAVDMNDYGPFSGDSRILHASHIFMMIVPLLWYLNKFISSNKMKYCLPLIFCVVVIVMHQHRSVWSSALVAMVFYTIAAARNKLISLSRMFGLIVGGLILIAVCTYFLSVMSPGFIDYLQERFAEIFNPSKEGSTGNFRIEQRETYFALYTERPVFGWTFEGFEMANPLVDWWPENTGQHFHEGYIEILFYHGAVGLLLKYSMLIYLLVKIFSRQLSNRSIILMCFCISGLVFSLSYVLPLIFWGHAGLCLYYLDKDRINRLIGVSARSAYQTTA